MLYTSIWLPAKTVVSIDPENLSGKERVLNSATKMGEKSA